MAEPTPAASHQPNPHVAPPRDSRTVLHRVCIQCNRMFRVTPDRFDAKQCPDCHKG